MDHRTDPAENYESCYRNFDSPLMRQVRQEAYGEDIGQHSWMQAQELRQDMLRLRISNLTRLVDLGCGPCGPLVAVVQAMGCPATGLERSEAALTAGRARCAAHGVEHLIQLRQLDLNAALPFAEATFGAALSIDVIPHLDDREATFRELRRILAPGGRFLFTDAAVVTGAISSDQVRWRSIHGRTRFAVHEFNRQCLERAGLHLLEIEDRTSSVIRNASGRLAARRTHRHELEGLEGAGEFEVQLRYLESVLALAESGSLSRIMYLAERPLR